eukprot:CAMPEP_0204907316 /NCGR_PEP_ID=MMETSP1397-20131031/6495_1 /ASSEMBLY_ACC=CAM_ASM_000891 /TAXON_ID=49980 /ORGANISM="Climacostomum Climacostomum virens, Strain Stock W-24" /LENGTH=335 /DNA_ID=CAMNT_0052076419 /DNA_START=66 /DNA_END=1070 /DNA_ORIENTATION=+
MEMKLFVEEVAPHINFKDCDSKFTSAVHDLQRQSVGSLEWHSDASETAELGRILVFDSSDSEDETQAAGPEDSNLVSWSNVQIFGEENPEFIYSYNWGSGMLYWERLKTGETFRVCVPLYEFKDGARWCETPCGDLYFTGGIESDVLSETVCISASRDFAVLYKPDMLNGRCSHCLVYWRGFIYCIGGRILREALKKTERYSLDSNQWEALPPMPSSLSNSCVLIDEPSQMLYAIGGYLVDSDYEDCSIQTLSLDRLEWSILEVKLPSTLQCSCFKFEWEFYIIQDQQLYKFDINSSKISFIRCVKEVQWHMHQPFYYNAGSFYSSNWYTQPERI